MVNPQPVPDEEYERKGFWARIKDELLGVEEEDD